MKHFTFVVPMYTGILSLIMYCLVWSACSTPSPEPDPVPKHDTFTIESKHVHETRIINVWLPPQYVNSMDSFPVLYMPDGGVKEDFPHMANTLDKLISLDSIPPMILVGIENTQRRRDLTGITHVEKDKEIAPVVGGADQFRAFIQDELFPSIQQRYRTNDTRSIIGESAAGLFVMETYFLQPEMFDGYMAFDPALWWNDHSLVRSSHDLLVQQDRSSKVLWFAGSSAEDIFPYTRQLEEVLRVSGLPSDQWKYEDEPKEKHTTIFRAKKEEALIWTLNAVVLR